MRRKGITNISIYQKMQFAIRHLVQFQAWVAWVEGLIKMVDVAPDIVEGTSRVISRVCMP